MALALELNDKNTILQSMVQAMQKQDEKEYVAAMVSLSEVIEKEVIEKAKELVGVQDAQVLATRGVRQLTSAEKKYYEKVVSAMKSNDPKQALTHLDVVMPETVIDQVFEDLRLNHPLLSKINFQNTKAMIKFLMNKNTFQKAVWGKLDAEITKEIASDFVEVDMTMLKLSAFIPVSQAMIDLGPSWLDNYIRTILYEALANGLEDGIVNCLRTDQGPVGMIANMTSGSAQSGYVQYTAKDTKVVTDFQPTTLGGLIGELSKTDKGNPRQIRNVLLIVNPTDYFTKVFPATTVMGGDGTYRKDVFPYPIEVIQSPAVASGKAVLGLGYRYFAGIGVGTKEGRIEYSDENQFLEDNRVYKIKLYGNGMPMDNTSFLYLDISGLKPATIKVTVEQSEPIEITGEVTTKAGE